MSDLAGSTHPKRTEIDVLLDRFANALAERNNFAEAEVANAIRALCGGGMPEVVVHESVEAQAKGAVETVYVNFGMEIVCEGCGDELRSGDEALVVPAKYYGEQCGCADEVLHRLDNDADAQKDGEV